MGPFAEDVVGGMLGGNKLPGDMPVGDAGGPSGDAKKNKKEIG